MRKYQSYIYVGSKEIFDRVEKRFEGKKIIQKENIKEWIQNSKQKLYDQSVIATFIINEKEELLINDRHSEHVICAGGRKVLSAGEITFRLEKKEIIVSEISNQSTGYCPKIDSWEIVEIVLSKLGVEHPEYFTKAFEFRYCENCETKSLIKEEIFECAVCGEDLDLEWNIDKIKATYSKT